MNNRKRTAMIMVPLMLVGLSGAVAWSQQGEGRRGDGPRIARAEGGGERGGRHWRGREGRRGRGGQERGIKRIAERLELSDEQVTKIKGVLSEARKKQITLRAGARVARIELREMVSADTVDKAKVAAKVDEIAKVGGDLLRARTDAVLAVREVLTPEQLAKADGLLERLMSGRRGRGRR